jgi:multisubunit Na+/H+ antiporter MnhE subunit
MIRQLFGVLFALFLTLPIGTGFRMITYLFDGSLSFNLVSCLVTGILTAMISAMLTASLLKPHRNAFFIAAVVMIPCLLLTMTITNSEEFLLAATSTVGMAAGFLTYPFFSRNDQL